MKQKLALCLLVGVSACATAPIVSLAPAGPVETATGFTINLKEDWTKYSTRGNLVTEGPTFTKDGFILNRLNLATLEDGDAFAKAGTDIDLPTFSSGMSALEQVDFISASMAKMGYEAIEPDNIRPITFDDLEGVRFDVLAKLETGLQVKGDVAVAEAEDKLHVIFFIAPSMHYFDASADEVDNIIQTVTLNETE